MALFELSSKKTKNGRRHFKATLYELQPPECVVDEVGTKYNKNGITFLEEYAKETLDSIKDMSVRVEFIDEERTMIAAHGLTGMEDGIPLFNNATNIGHFTEGYIADVEVKGEIKRCVCGKGYLDEMAYHPFIVSLEEQLKNGESIDGSIEIFKTENNDALVYKYGWKEFGRIPTEYIHSGWDIVATPADPSSTLLELNNSKNNEEENPNMEFNMEEVKSVIQTTISELNSKEENLNAQISELNATIEKKDCEIASKDNEICELNSTIEQVRKALADMEAERESYWAEKEYLVKELGELKAKARLGELNSKINCFTEEEKKFAEVEINSFNEDPINGDIDSIVSKIYAGIGIASKEADVQKKTNEQNSAASETIDIFSEVCSVNVTEEEDVSIF